MKNNNISRKSGFIFFLIMLRPPISTLFPYTTLFRSVRARNSAQQNACINNLRQVDGAKQQWALETKAASSASPTSGNIQPYLGRGTAGTLPNCPSDSAKTFATSYTMGDLNTAPVCQINT